MKPDILRPLHLGVFLAALLRLLATASPAAALASAASLPDGRSMVDRARVRAVERAGNILGVRADSKGRLFYHSLNSRGRKKARALSDPEAARVMSFLRKVPAQDSEAFMAASLQSYLRPRMDPRDLDRNLFVERDSRGFLALTAVGKNALMDILLAEDGQLLEKDIQKLGPAMHPRLCGQDARQCERRPGFSPSAFFARVRPAAAGISPSAGDFASAFDGSRSRPSGRFDWETLEQELLLARGPGGSPPPSLRNYAFQPEKNAVRVIVAAPRAGPADHLGIGGSAKRLQSERRSIYRERGLDPGLLDRHGSRLVRVIGDLVVVDIPLYEAVPLARDLEKRGIASSPSRVFQAAASQLPLDAALPRDNARSTARAAAAATRPAPYLGGQFLPLSSPEVAEAGHEDSYRRMDLQSLWKLSEGRGTTVGVIDSGIDASHPDFQGRIAEYVDFTGEGLEDVQGHGTHGEGTIGGSGVASGGQYRGVAPQTRFLVAKVFGRNEEASLDTILAAMRWMGERKPDVLNLSFGDKGLDPNQDPLGFLANQLVVKDGILVVSPAGNTGPGFETINTPGNARYVLTVSGVDKDGKFPFFVSQGVVKDKSGGRYNKPDVTAISGGVFVPSEPGLLERMLSAVWGGEPQGCAYAPGVVAARSAADPDTRCALAGNPRYRTLSGTSMAANMGSGAALDVIGYAKGRGIKPRPAEVKAVLQETAVDAGHPREMQGAGLIQGRRLAQAVQERIERGLPIGNVAYMLASRAVTRLDRPALKAQTRYRETPLGLLDVKTGHLVRTEGEMATVMKRLRRREKLTASRPSI